MANRGDNNWENASQQSSNYGDVSAHQDANNNVANNSNNFNTHVQVVKKVVSGNVVIEGYLKKLKKYLMSSKNFYRVVGKVMLVASNPKKQFTEKYDLTNYQV